MNKNERGKQMEKKNIYYLVKLKEGIEDNLYYRTTTKNQFCGKLVNNNGKNFYFELNGSNALVIIPHSWIEWMAPSKVLWNVESKLD